MNYNNEIFPNIELNNNIKQENLQIQLYGKRIRTDQTVPEYLLEFLLTFIGEYRCEDGKISTGFDKFRIDAQTKYTVNPNIAFKRFVFFENSKLENRYDVDRDAYEELKDLLKVRIKSSTHSENDILDIVQELFYGFSAVTKNRGWFAQSLMPICREVMFPEAMGKSTTRKGMNYTDSVKMNNQNKKILVDSNFEFKEYNFMARGGEVYYLHLMQYLVNDCEMKYRLQKKLFELIDSYPEIRILSEWINNTWNLFLSQKLNKSENEIRNILKEEKMCQWIPIRYNRRSKYYAKELDNILSCEASQFEKIDLLNVGICMQILRMMTESAKIISEQAEEGKYNETIGPMWLIHIPSTNDELNRKTKKLAVESYKIVEEYMQDAVAKILKSNDGIVIKSSKKTKSELARIKDANKDSYKLLRKLGKEIGLIVPLKGDNMRFSIDDSIIRYLVLSIVKPESKVTLDTFLDRLYEYYGIVIGPIQYERYIDENNIIDNIEISFLNDNLMEFQKLLRNNGFLRELSDATSIVENNYSKTEGNNEGIY